MKHTICTGLALTLGSLIAGCSGQDAAGSEPAELTAQFHGTLRAALMIPVATSDVSDMSYKIVAGGDSCDDGEVIAERTVPLEEEALPAGLDADDADGNAHAFADAFFVLEPGDYRACATPMTADGDASQQCSEASGDVTVMEEVTTEIALVSQCEGDPNGAADIITELNHPPTIDDLELEPSKFITTCESVELTASASDEDGDTVAYSWSIEATPDDSTDASLEPDGETATFSPDVAGDYQLKVTAADDHGVSTSLSFPVHVSDEADCSDQDDSNNQGGQSNDDDDDDHKDKQ